MVNKRDIVYVPVKLVRNNKHQLMAIALYLKARRHYVKNILYNYSPERLAVLFDTSPYQVRKSMAVLKKLGLIKKVKNDIRIQGIEKTRGLFKGSGSVRLMIHRGDTINVIKKKLHYLLLKSDIINRQQYIFETYIQLNNLENNRLVEDYKIAYSKAKKRMNKLSKLGYSFGVTKEGYSDEICAGYRKIAGCVGISVGNVKPFLDELVSWGYLRGYKRKKEAFYISNGNSPSKSNKYIDNNNNNRFYTYIYNNSIIHDYGTILLPSIIPIK